LRPRVLLIQPPIYDFALYDLFFKSYGLLRIGNWFSRNGYDVMFLNCLDWEDERSVRKFGKVKRTSHGTGKFFRQPALLPQGIPPIPRQYSRYGIDRASMIEQIRSAQADIICITSGMTYWYEGVKETGEICRTVSPRSKIILGGIYATLMPDHALRTSQADAVVTDHVESTLQTLMEKWEFPPLKGEIPEFPMLIDSAWQGSAGVVRLNRGCPLNCDYCASRVIHPIFRRGDAHRSYAFIEELNRRYGTSHVGFYDDALLVGKEDVFLPFLEHAIASPVTWKFYTPNAMHIRLIDKQSAELMLRSGFQEVRMGFESSQEEFHLQHDGKFDTHQFAKAVEILKEAGFDRRQLKVYVLAGLPGQRKEEIAESISAAAEAGVGVSIAEFSPVPGTTAWKETAVNSPYPLESEPLYHNNSFQVTAWDGLTREDMQELKSAARKTLG
jgi:radical SAM superfamily enzyme YgiQ (UPF0313 family)